MEKKAIIKNKLERDPADVEVFFGTLEDLKGVIRYNYFDEEFKECYEETGIPEGVEEALEAETFEDVLYYIDFYNLDVFGYPVELELITDKESVEDRELLLRHFLRNNGVSKRRTLDEIALRDILDKIDEDIKDSFISDSDEDYYLFDIIKESIRKWTLGDEDVEEENIEEYTDKFYDDVKNYLNKNYKVVYHSSANGNATVYYFDNKFNFKNCEELEKYFKI